MINNLKNNNINVYCSNKANKNTGQTFKGNFTTALGKVESNPVISLALIDFLGMIVPRTIIDLKRNKEELGHNNWDAARETALRESTTSVMLFFLPGIVATKIGQAFIDRKFKDKGINTLSFIDFNTLDNSKKAMRKIIEDAKKNTLNQGQVSVIKLRQEYLKTMFNENNVVSKMKDKPFSKLSRELIKYINSKDTIRKAIIDPNSDKLSKQFKEFEKYHFNNLIDSKNADSIAEMIKKEIGESKVKFKDSNKVLSVDNFIMNTTTFADDLILRPSLKISNFDKNNVGKLKVNINEFEKTFNETVKVLEKFKKLKLYTSLATALTLLLAFPKINMWISKKSCGNDQFPGVKGLKTTDVDYSRSGLFLFQKQEKLK